MPGAWEAMYKLSIKQHFIIFGQVGSDIMLQEYHNPPKLTTQNYTISN